MLLFNLKKSLGRLTHKKRELARFSDDFNVLVSFPRSGSNFVQSVIERSSRRYAKSIYRLNIPRFSKIFNLKSHALSPDHLRDEMDLFFENSHPLKKICILNRDPRDVMISFYEFVKARKKISFSQKDFFLSTCYYYCTYNDGRNILLRRSQLEPLNVKQAFQIFYKEWCVLEKLQDKKLMVKYEDFLSAPVEVFGKLFDFYRLESNLKIDSLKTKVSQYGNVAYKRATAGGWRNNEKMYKQLIQLTSQHLEEEIVGMGYG